VVHSGEFRMGGVITVGCQDQLVRQLGQSCKTTSPCCKEMDKDFDIEHTNLPNGTSMMRVFVMNDDEQGATIPVGLVLEESLQHLTPLERQLVLFSASSNLPAVRWLLYLGASLDVCDANGTTCLHAACRSGSTGVVSELLRHRSALEAMDQANWMPLHIAAHMGRPEVVSRLLQARANPLARNAWGHTPIQLCSNAATQSAFTHKPLTIQGKPLDAAARETTVDSTVQDGIDQVEGEPEWWFINPEPAFTHMQPFIGAATKIGVLLFNKRPTHGLAFMVASGVAENYTNALHLLLADPHTSRSQVGNFLGESLSMCNAMRFGIFDSMPFMSTGVITALVTGFNSFRMPPDLQKVNRLVHGVALAWWRHHQYWVAVEASGIPDHIPRESNSKTAGEELVGLQLLQYLASCSVLSQLMFSTVMLHWFIHRDGRGDKQVLPLELWMKLNKGIENSGNDVPDHVQRRIYDVITQRFIPCLDISSAVSTSNDEVALVPEVLSNPTHLSVLTPRADLESAVHLLDDALSLFQADAQNPNKGELSNAVFLGEQVTVSPATASLSVSSWWPDGSALVTLSSAFIFFSTYSQGEAQGKKRQNGSVLPSALTDARRLRVETVDESQFVITFIAGLVSASTAGRPQGIPMLYILPDGRWQQLSLSKLRLKFSDSEEMALWQKALAKYTNSQAVVADLAEVRTHLHC